MKFRLARLNCHYAAHLLDLGHDIQLNASMAKAFNCESALESARDVIHMMGGDGVTPLYLPHSFFALGKVEEIAGGTMEAMRLAIYRMGLKEMAEDLEMPNRVIHEELGVPINTYKWPERDAKINEEKLLKVLAEDYRVNPALHMSREDLKKFFEVEDKKLDDLLMSLEEKGLVDLYRVKKGIALAKATYEGLDKANPPEYYRWFPSWADETRRF
jgi:hypothetical protein